jgi:hypothetical protein
MRKKSPYAPRSTGYLDGLKAGLDGEDLSLPTEDEILRAQGDPVAMQNLIARAKAAQSRFDSASGNSYLMDAGRMKVANPFGAISDMFVRGNAKRDLENANKSAEQLSQEQRTSAAKLSRREIAREQAERIERELTRISELDRKDAQAVEAEQTRQKERGEDRGSLTLRQQLDEQYRQEQLKLDREALRAKLGQTETGPKPTYKDLMNERELAAKGQNAAAGMDQTLDIIDKALKHPGLKGAVGAKGASSLFGLRDEPIAGTDAAGFKAIHDQLAGKAFLEAFANLRGGGQISTVEGQKAEQAMARLSLSQNEADYKEALNDLRDIVISAKARTGGRTPQINQAPQGAGNSEAELLDRYK